MFGNVFMLNIQKPAQFETIPTSHQKPGKLFIFLPINQPDNLNSCRAIVRLRQGRQHKMLDVERGSYFRDPRADTLMAWRRLACAHHWENTRGVTGEQVTRKVLARSTTVPPIFFFLSAGAFKFCGRTFCYKNYSRRR